MSYAVHLLVTEKFSWRNYQGFLHVLQNLFGNWVLEESVAFNENGPYLTIHECWIKSEESASSDFTRVIVTAHRHLKETPVWTHDYQWHLRLERGSMRTPMSLAVQLAGWQLAMRRFRYSMALDRDSSLEGEPTEFLSMEAAADHVRRVLNDEFEVSAKLIQQGILDERGYLKLGSQ